MPPGVLNLVTGDARAIGKAMCEHPAVRVIGFTGSTEVGKVLMAQAAGTVKKVGLELGGNAPFIVFDDAHVDAAVEGAIVSKFRNMGQTCVCANRIYAQEGIYDAFVAKLTDRGRASSRSATGREAGVTQGPLINEAAVEKVEEHVADALKKGAKVVDRRQAPSARPHLLRADGALRRRRHDAGRARGDLRPGRAGLPLQGRSGRDRPGQRHRNSASRPISTPAISAASGASPRRSNTAWSASTPARSRASSRRSAGVKESGIGREGSRHGVEEFVEMKYMLMGGLDR